MQHNETPHRKSEKKPFGPTKRKEGTNLDPGNNESEINPEKLDREETNYDRAGFDHSKGHEPYEFKKLDHPLKKNYAIGSQSGSTGYKPSTKEVDINKLGRGLH